ncbi:hypothetical protein TNIN_16541 [Trichonephila inaurata madagascariensis]|uniref:Uncharacterized protein n=1 Tax=Trichonephila inaurata madagascariensis TaxID=2747483 RepID=A0A8X6WXN8_9ARAC|nr:hypothetical protein TNIN_16541 [Trichonephila inaurata madagascariensis]
MYHFPLKPATHKSQFTNRKKGHMMKLVTKTARHIHNLWSTSMVTAQEGLHILPTYELQRQNNEKRTFLYEMSLPSFLLFILAQLVKL